MEAIIGWLTSSTGIATILSVIVAVKTLVDGIDAIWSKDADTKDKLIRIFFLAWHAAESISGATGQVKLADFLTMVEGMAGKLGIKFDDKVKELAIQYAAVYSKAVKSPSMTVNAGSTEVVNPK